MTSAMPRAHVLRFALLLCCAALVAADPPGSRPRHLPSPEQIAAAHTRFEPFSERVPFSTEPLDMIAIKGGTFLMSPLEKDGQPRQVEVKSFYIAKTELTWDHYDAFFGGANRTPEEVANDARHVKGPLRSRPSQPYGNPDANFGHQGFPVLCVTHGAATRFCKWLSEKTGRKYRLPTEAEWEYAARAGGPATLDRATLDAVAWHRDNSEEKLHPAGERKPNAWGLYDMLGNAAELCNGPDGQVVARGGSYNTRPTQLTAAHRDTRVDRWSREDPNEPKAWWWHTNGQHITFRVVCETADPKP